MILDDLFENPILLNVKMSDIPPTMRQRLTMRDIEAERPRSAFRYQVGDKKFMDLRAAQEFARGTQQPVIPIGEEQEMSEELIRKGTPESVGYMYLAALEKARKSREPVTLDYGGGNRIRISDPNIKTWFVNRFVEAKKQKNPEYLQAFLINMGTLEGVRALMRRMQQDVPAQYSDVQTEKQVAESDQKKRSNLDEQDKEEYNARTQRIMGLMRARQPQAKSDSEAMLYDFMAAQKRDRRDIERLEKERDDIEKNIKQDLEKDIASLKQRRGQRVDVSQLQAKNQEQDRAIKKIAQIQQQKDKLDQEQQQEIGNLEKAVASQPTAAAVTPKQQTPAAAEPARPAQPIEPANGAAAGRFGAAIQGLTTPLAQPPSPTTAGPAKVTPITKAKKSPSKRQTAPLPWAANDDGGQESRTGTLNEEDRPNARINRILKQLRARHPQAKDDLEALIYDFRGSQRQDRHDISRLDMENDMEEADIERLEQILANLKKQRALAEKRDRTPGKISKSEDPCWPGHHMIGTKEKAGRTVPNCVPGTKG